MHEDRSMLNLPVRNGEDGGVADDDVLRERGCRNRDCRQCCHDNSRSHFLLPVNGNMPSVVDTVPSMFAPCSVPWKTQSPASPPLACTAIENCTVVPSNVPLPMSPEPRSPENVPLTWPFSTCS